MQPSNRTIIGVAMLLFGSVLLGFGMHHVIATGTCSSTGYSSNYGPVPYCPKGEGWWILFIIAGIMLAVFGGLVSAGSSAMLIVPAIFAGIGIGSLTVAFDAHAKSGTKTFALIFGGAFALFGLVPLVIVGFSALGRAGRSRRPKEPFGATTLPSDPILGAYATTPSTSPSTAWPVSAPATTVTPGFSTPATRSAPPAVKQSSDALDKIAKLAALHKEGALTDAEFSQQKAKLLAEM